MSIYYTIVCIFLIITCILLFKSIRLFGKHRILYRLLAHVWCFFIWLILLKKKYFDVYLEQYIREDTVIQKIVNGISIVWLLKLVIKVVIMSSYCFFSFPHHKKISEDQHPHELTFVRFVKILSLCCLNGRISSENKIYQRYS